MAGFKDKELQLKSQQIIDRALNRQLARRVASPTLIQRLIEKKRNPGVL